MASCPSQANPKPHAVLFPFPAQGHINPMMLLAKALASHGVHISLVTTEYTISQISRARENGTPLSDLADVHLIGLPDGLPDDCNRDILGPYLAKAVDNMGEAFEAVLQDLHGEERPVTCVIGDCFVRRVRDIAQKLSIPRIAFWPQSVTVFTLYYHSKLMISSGFDPFDGNVKSFGPKQPLDPITCVPGVSPIHPSYLPFETTFGVPGLYWLKLFIEEQFENIVHEAIWVIGNSFEDLEPQVCKALPHLQPIGPLLPQAFLPEEKSREARSLTSFWKEDDCTEWLDKQPDSSVLYVSFGSLRRFSVAQIQEIAYGLIASEHQFLWVIRPDTIVESVTNSLEALPEGFLNEVKEKGKIINWAPQAQVLAHPSVSGFFSHCGWNSTMESICEGVPLLGWPEIFDQATNCWLVINEWKIGLELERDEENKTDRRKVERAVRSLMGGGQAAEEMRARADSLRSASRRAAKADSSSRMRLHSLVEDLYNRSVNKSSPDSIQQ